MFKFSLETVLKQRRILEENAARALAEVELKLKNGREKLAQMENSQERQRQASLKALAQGLPVAEMELARFREVKLMHEVNSNRELLAMIEQDKALKETELLARVKDRRLLEKVREQHQQEWQRGQMLLERKSLDEVAIVRAARLRK
jgi:flagellar FliJ protein